MMDKCLVTTRDPFEPMKLAVWYTITAVSRVDAVVMQMGVTVRRFTVQVGL